MRTLLLGLAVPLAALAVPAAPAAAQGFAADSGRQFDRDSRDFGFARDSGRFDGCYLRGDRRFRAHRDRRDDRDRRHRRDRRVDCDISFGTFYEGGEWALYNNRSWESDSYNDWWHDRPDRAYPRWMRNNQDCARPWYAGSTLRC